MSKLNVLISLHKGYGLGDAVQMSAVLRHVAKYRPNWNIDFRAQQGQYCVGRGIVNNVFGFDNPQPTPYYDAEVEILLYDTWANWHDRPNTRVSSALRERFDLDWDAECGRYEINISRDAGYAAQNAMSSFIAKRQKLTTRPVALHYQGDSSPDKKNLSNLQASIICDYVLRLERVPLLMDWRDKCLAANKIGVCTTGRHEKSKEWGPDAEMNCAIISQCQAFVGIDSGPSKCASATNTPALVVWTGHHPAPFHDPAPNTTHLVPEGYHGLFPVCNDPSVIAWFEKHHTVRTYKDDPVQEVGKWLKEVLN